MLNADAEHRVSVSFDRDLIFPNSCLIYLKKCTLLASMFAFWEQHDRLYVIFGISNSLDHVLIESVISINILLRIIL
jgi:hypothetical protein